MIVLPAIDIKNGIAVRLYQGDFDTAHKVADDPLGTAIQFEKDGADWIHIVDLDGALRGEPVNTDIIREIVSSTDLYVEVGGGIRTMKSIEEYIKAGVKRVIMGSAALSDPNLVKEAVGKYEDMIAVGIDAKNGNVKSNGWTESSETNYLDLALKMDEAGVRTLIYTDIEKDGMLKGPNKEDLEILNSNVDANIVASGGVGNIDDIGTLASLGLYGTICGKALYTGDLNLAEALDIARNFR